MIALNYPQGSIEWVTARLWRLTASKAKDNIAAAGSLSKSVKALESIDKLIAGIDLAQIMQANPACLKMDDYELQNFIADFTGDKFKGNVHTLRGNKYEHVAMAELSEVVGEQFHEIGMCVMGDDPDGVVSCSPDGYTSRNGTMYQGGEVKCPTLSTYNSYIAERVLPPQYKLQVHFSMAVCEVETWHFGAKFVNEHIERPLMHIPVQWDAFTDKVHDSLIAFHDQYRDRYNQVQDGLNTIKTTNKKGIELPEII